MPPDTTLLTDEPEIVPFSADDTTETFRGTTSHVAEQSKADLHHVIAAASTIQQRTKQHEHENERHRNAERDSEYALGD
jgi:hypothetical protein